MEKSGQELFLLGEYTSALCRLVSLTRGSYEAFSCDSLSVDQPSRER